MKTITEVLIIAGAWIFFHGIFLVLRLGLSSREEWRGRIKLFGQGVLWVLGLIILGYIGDWVGPIISPVGELKAISLGNILAFFLVSGLLIAWFVAILAFLLAHASTLWASWISDDFEVWCRMN